MAPLQGKRLQAAPTPATHLLPLETQPLQSGGCRSQSRRRKERLRGEEGGLLRGSTVAGRLLPKVPHDPGPNAETKEKVISGRQLLDLESKGFGKYLSLLYAVIIRNFQDNIKNIPG